MHAYHHERFSSYALIMRTPHHARSSSCLFLIDCNTHHARSSSCILLIIRAPYHVYFSSCVLIIMNASHHARFSSCKLLSIRVHHYACCSSCALLFMCAFVFMFFRHDLRFLQVWMAWGKRRCPQYFWNKIDKKNYLLRRLPFTISSLLRANKHNFWKRIDI